MFSSDYCKIILKNQRRVWQNSCVKAIQIYYYWFPQEGLNMGLLQWYILKRISESHEALITPTEKLSETQFSRILVPR